MSNERETQHLALLHQVHPKLGEREYHYRILLHGPISENAQASKDSVLQGTQTIFSAYKKNQIALSTIIGLLLRHTTVVNNDLAKQGTATIMIE
jgi:hypothetical protein